MMMTLILILLHLNLESKNKNSYKFFIMFIVKDLLITDYWINEL